MLCADIIVQNDSMSQVEQYIFELKPSDYRFYFVGENQSIQLLLLVISYQLFMVR